MLAADHFHIKAILTLNYGLLVHLQEKQLSNLFDSFLKWSLLCKERIETTHIIATDIISNVFSEKVGFDISCELTYCINKCKFCDKMFIWLFSFS